MPSDDLAKQISSRLFAGYGLDLVIGGFAVTDLAVFAVSCLRGVRLGFWFYWRERYSAIGIR
jgi:hypothetical protein